MLDILPYELKSGNYTVTVHDAGKTFICSAALNLTLPACSAAKIGFTLSVHNVGVGIVSLVVGGGSDIVKIGPSSLSSLAILPGESAVLVMTGATSWSTNGFARMSDDGWIPAYDALTRSSVTTNPTTYVMNCANANQKYQVGDKIRLRNNSVAYAINIDGSFWNTYLATKSGDTIGFTATAQNGCIYQDITTIPGTYTLTVQAKVASGTRAVWFGDENSNTGGEFTLTTSYQTITTTITTTSGTIRLMCRDRNSSGFVAIQTTQWNLPVVKYFYVVAVTSSTMTLAAGSDYNIQSYGAVTDIAYSRLERPWGFPEWFNYIPYFPDYAGLTYRANGGAAGTQPVVQTAFFNLKGRKCSYSFNVYGNIGGTAGNTVSSCPPINPSTRNVPNQGFITETSTGVPSTAVAHATDARIYVYKLGSNIGQGDWKYIGSTGFYMVAA